MAAPRTARLSWQRMAPSLATLLLIVLVVGCLYWARAVLIPVAVAMLLTFILGPLVLLLERRGLPRAAAVSLVVALSCVLLASALWLVGSQVIQLLADLPSYQDNVAKRVAEVRQRGSGNVLANVQRFVHEVSVAATGPTATQQAAADEEAVTVRVVERAAASSIASWLPRLQPVAEPFLLASGVLVLVIYLLIFRDDLRSRILALVGRGNLTLTTKALDDADRRISRYLLAQFALNLGFGACIALGLLVLGVPQALLWGFAAGLLRYIPYLGPWMAATLPVGMSLLSSAGWFQPLAVVALFAICEFSSNLVVEPLVYGQSIGVSPAALIVAIVFWTWLWGPLGMVLAAPMTMCLVVLGKYVPGLGFIDVLLGDQPVLTADVTVYQRLLARDEDEAAEIARHQAQGLSPIDLCDKVFVPALAHARRDFQAGLLSGEEYQSVLAGVLSIAEHQELAVVAMGARQTERAAAALPQRPSVTVLACPAQDGADANALALFQQVLDPFNFQLEQVSPKRLVSEVLEIVQANQPAVVCIATLPPGGLAHTRHLCKRLRNRFPAQKILIGRWGAAEPPNDRDAWSGCGADHIGVTFADTLKQLDWLGQFLRHLQRPTAERQLGTSTPTIKAAAGNTFAPG